MFPEGFRQEFAARQELVTRDRDAYGLLTSSNTISQSTLSGTRLLAVNLRVLCEVLSLKSRSSTPGKHCKLLSTISPRQSLFRSRIALSSTFQAIYRFRSCFYSPQSASLFSARRQRPTPAAKPQSYCLQFCST